MSDYPPLTEEEQTTLDQLTYQQAMADWAAREAARQAALAKLAPLANVDYSTISTALDAVQANGVDEDVLIRLTRIKTILRIDLQGLLDLKAKLEIAEPEPEAPPA